MLYGVCCTALFRTRLRHIMMKQVLGHLVMLGCIVLCCTLEHTSLMLYQIVHHVLLCSNYGMSYHILPHLIFVD